MRTPWSADAEGPVPWPEYPRPQLVRDRWLNLNGRWRYAVTARAAAAPAGWDGEIVVPFAVEAGLSGVGRSVGPDERVWYSREVIVPESWAGDRVILHFGAVDFEAAVWFNGAFVGAHRGGFDPFSFDVTPFLAGRENVLVVGAWDPTNRGDQGRGKQHLSPEGIWYTPVTGIWQTVWLEPVPAEQHIAEVRITPHLAESAVDVETILGRPSTRTDVAVRVRVIEDGREVATRLAAPDRRVRLEIAGARAWSPGDPFLYDVVAEVVPVDDVYPGGRIPAGARRANPLRGADEAARYASAVVTGPAVDAVRTYFGMRSVEVAQDAGTGRPALLLNGRAVFHLGPLDQGWWPDGLLTPPSDRAIVYEIEYLKSAGFNALRKHVKVEPARYYHHCDRLGMLVWQDMPTGFAPAQFVAANDEDEALKPAASMEQQELEMRRIIAALRAHPSVVMWVLHNEGWGQYDTRRLAEWVRGLDPSRLVDAASGWFDVGAGDVYDLHDYGDPPTARGPSDGRALVLGEFGGIGWPVEGHLLDPGNRNWGYQTYHSRSEVESAYRRKLEAIIALRGGSGLSAAIYTQTTDVEGEVNGLLTYDRAVEKLSPEWLRGLHRELTGEDDGPGGAR